MPQPYNRTELRTLQATLDQRSPLDDEAEKWLRRFTAQRSPYSRIRSHVIRAQLECIVSLALHMGLRRGEIFRASVHDIDPGNFGAVAWDTTHSAENAREVPWTSAAHFAVEQWLTCRQYLGAEHDRPWLNLHAGPTAALPLTVHTFNRLLVTYLGREWSFQRLRATCAAGWVRTGMPLDHLRQLLGLSRIEDVLPYARLVRGSLEGEMAERDELFTELVSPLSAAA